MLKIKLIILIAGITLLTLFVGLANPTMHKQAMFTDSNYKFVEESTETIQDQITPVKEEIKPQSVTAKSIEVKNTPIQTNTQKTTVKQVPIKTVQTKISQNKVKSPSKKVEAKPLENLKQTKEPIVENKPVVKTPPVIEVEPIQKQETTQQKVLTEQEEIIVWNKWRSDLQNQVMRDTKIGAPMGTGFKFSFTVDKFGNMSNVKVWSTNDVYTNLAVRVIKPVLMSYQRQPILNFPQGTKRVITNVTGGFYISTTTEYSTPSDYSDYEKVRR